MSQNFVPEMHDLGKLVNHTAVVRDILSKPKTLVRVTARAQRALEKVGRIGGHCFDWIEWTPKFPEPITTTFRVLQRHHRERTQKEDRYAKVQKCVADLPDIALELLLLRVADAMAAIVSRPLAKKIGDTASRYYRQRKKGSPKQAELIVEGIEKLWHRDFYQERKAQGYHWHIAASEEKLRQVFDFIRSDPKDETEFFRRYGRQVGKDELWLTPEDKTPPRSVTTLYTHSKLVGKFYRLLRPDCRLIGDRLGHREYIKDRKAGKDVLIETTQKAVDRWQFVLACCRVRFAQRFADATDLNVIGALEATTRELTKRESQWYDNIVLHTSNTLWVVLPPTRDAEDRLGELLSAYTNQGFYVETRLWRGTLRRREPSEDAFKFLKWDRQTKKKIEEKIGELTIAQAERTAAREERDKLRARVRAGQLAGDALIFQQAIERARRLEKRLKELETRITYLPQERAYYPDAHRARPEVCLPEEIVLPAHLCEICQMRPVTQYWEQATREEEHLCEVCWSLRKLKEKPFPLLERWGRSSRIRTAWVRINLNYDVLAEVLEELFQSYVAEKLGLDEALAQEALEKSRDQEKQEESERLLGRLEQKGGELRNRVEAFVKSVNDLNPLALMVDFTEDYHQFLEAINDRLSEDKRYDRRQKKEVSRWEYEVIAKDFKDFYVIRLNREEDVRDFLRIYSEELLRHFSYLKDYYAAFLKDLEAGKLDDQLPEIPYRCPIELSIELARAKYPFYEHWDFLSDPQAEVNIQIPEIGLLRLPYLTFRQLRVLLGAEELSKEEKAKEAKTKKKQRKGQLISFTRTFMHRLRAAEARSGSATLVEAMLLEAAQVDRVESKRVPEGFKEVARLFGRKAIRASDLLCYDKALRWGRERQ